MPDTNESQTSIRQLEKIYKHNKGKNSMATRISTKAIVAAFALFSTITGFAQETVTPKTTKSDYEAVITYKKQQDAAQTKLTLVWGGKNTVGVWLDSKPYYLSGKGQKTIAIPSTETNHSLSLELKPGVKVAYDEFLIIEEKIDTLYLAYDSTNKSIRAELSEERASKRDAEINASNIPGNESNGKEQQLPEEYEDAYKDIAMILVKGGMYQTDDGYKHNRTVTVTDFSIGKTEVTQAQWESVMDYNPSHFKNCPNCPVENVSWDDVQVYIDRLNMKTGKRYRLPTEAEWEYASRGGNKSKCGIYSGSDNIDDLAWFDSNSEYRTHPVASKKPNELGIYDMTGNVWEWCSDWYDFYSNTTCTNPQGPLTGEVKVLRGGSWYNRSQRCRNTYRNSNSYNFRFHYYGFRLVCDN